MIQKSMQKLMLLSTLDRYIFNQVMLGDSALINSRILLFGDNTSNPQ